MLPTTGLLKRFMLGLRSNRESAPLVLLLRARTVGQLRTAAAIGGGELDLDDLVLPVVDGRRPADTRMPLRGRTRIHAKIDQKPIDLLHKPTQTVTAEAPSEMRNA